MQPAQHLSGPLLIIWDRLPAHRSRLVSGFVRAASKAVMSTLGSTD